jgi:hypothetical protein
MAGCDRTHIAPSKIETLIFIYFLFTTQCQTKRQPIPALYIPMKSA